MLERAPPLDPAATVALWQHMRAALTAMHELGFAHMDVTPSNICHMESESFMLVDLGSVTTFGGLTQSTRSYLPRELFGKSTDAVVAHPSTDWWMLACTLSEKGCEPALEISGAKVHTKAEIRAHLAMHLPAAVWAELRLLLE